MGADAARVAGAMSAWAHLDSARHGVFALADLFYFVSIAVLGLCWTILALEAQRGGVR